MYVHTYQLRIASEDYAGANEEEIRRRLEHLLKFGNLEKELGEVQHTDVVTITRPA